MNYEECYGDDLFSGERADEADRLRVLGDAFDHNSRAVLSSLDIKPGWKCLDVGAGPGTIARWLADQLGPDGEVTALDLDTRHLDRLTHPRVRVEQGDITDPGCDPGQFDLVHARFLLMHLRERDQVLKRMATWLKPGGLLVVTDTADLGTQSSPNAAYRATMAALWTVLGDTIGTDMNHGRRYPKLLADLGLSQTSLSVDLPVVSAGSSLAAFWRMTICQAVPRMLEAGLVDHATLEATFRYLASCELNDLSIAVVTGIGRG